MCFKNLLLNPRVLNAELLISVIRLLNEILLNAEFFRGKKDGKTEVYYHVASRKIGNLIKQESSIIVAHQGKGYNDSEQKSAVSRVSRSFGDY